MPSYSKPSAPATLDPMSDERFQAIVEAALDDAESFIDDDIAPKRKTATEYFYGEPLGTEIPGRSQIVMTEVRDVVRTIMPGLMRVFTGSEHVVEFAPPGEADVEGAKQATDYIDHIFMKDNDGFGNIYNVALDGLVRKTGIFKWYWDDAEKVTEEKYEGQTPEQVVVLASEPGVEIVEQEIGEDGLVSATVRKTEMRGKPIVCSVPPEEFLISRDARDEETGRLVGHRREMTVSDLVAMGYDFDEVLARVDSGFTQDNSEALVRNPALHDVSRSETGDPAMRTVKYCEILMRVDRDGDGIAELLKICTVGDNYSMIGEVEPAPEVNYAIFCPHPEPHTAIGLSVADEVMDLQKIKSNVMRFTLDGMAQAIVGRTAVDMNNVNMDDMADNSVGATIRTKGPPANSILPITNVFPVEQSLLALNYLDEIKSSRTGISKASAGLDLDVLQNTTKAAVVATTSAAEMRQEVIARFFAETLRKVFRGVLKMVKRHQDAPRMFRLRDKFVPVDPRTWNADMDVTVNVAVGTANRQDRFVALGGVAAKQEQAIMKFGPDNILCDVGQYRNTLAEMLSLLSFKDPGRFFKEVTPEAIAALKQQMAQQPPADPKIEAEKMKTQASVMIEQMKAKLDMEKTVMELAFREKELALKEKELALQAAELQITSNIKGNEITLRAQGKDGGTRVNVGAQKDDMAEMAKMFAQYGASIGQQIDLSNKQVMAAIMAPRAIEISRDENGRATGALNRVAVN